MLNSIAKNWGHELGSEKANSFENLDDFHIIWKDHKRKLRRIGVYTLKSICILAREREKLKDLVGSIIQSKDMDLELKKYEQIVTILRIEIIELLENYKENQNSISELVGFGRGEHTKN